MYFQILGSITDIEVIARGVGVQVRKKHRKKYGAGTWRKLKGKAQIQLQNGNILHAEVHWYEAHGIGKKDIKIKKFLA